MDPADCLCPCHKHTPPLTTPCKCEAITAILKAVHRDPEATVAVHTCTFPDEACSTCEAEAPATCGAVDAEDLDACGSCTDCRSDDVLDDVSGGDSGSAADG